MINNEEYRPGLVTEEELIEYLRIPEVSKAKDPHYVIDNLKRMRDLPCIHIANKCLYPTGIIRRWIEFALQRVDSTAKEYGDPTRIFGMEKTMTYEKGEITTDFMPKLGLTGKEMGIDAGEGETVCSKPDTKIHGLAEDE